MRNLPAEIYVVTHGDYEDYRIAAIFVDKPLAEQFAEALDDFGRVETYHIQTTMPKKRRLYHVNVDATGAVIFQQHEDYWDVEDLPEKLAGLNGTGTGAWAQNYRSPKAAIEAARAKLKEAAGAKGGAV